MAYEIRKVTPGWMHPLKPGGNNGQYQPLGDNYEAYLKEWQKRYEEMTNEEERKEWEKEKPDPKEYMLVGIPMKDRTCYQMYENTSEGTPTSKVFETKEEILKYSGWDESTLDNSLEGKYSEMS